jgi:hypothetical protein
VAKAAIPAMSPERSSRSAGECFAGTAIDYIIKSLAAKME